MKDWTNWRWKSRKATSSGPVDSKVAAVMMDQSMPWSVAENTCSPTVTGRVLTDSVTMSGHRKLFQWYDTDTSAYARYVGRASGTYTFHSVCSGVQPSTRAASSSSRGTVLKVWRSRKMPKALAM